MALFCFLLLSFFAQGDAQPLPDLKTFLAEFRKTLHTNNLLLSQYTYTETETHIQLDSSGKPKNKEIKIYQVLRGPEPDDEYRRLISKDGVPVSQKELDRQDRERQKEMEDREQKRQKKTPEELAKARADKEREDDKIIDDIFTLYDIRLIGRESVDGHSTIRMSFKARPAYKPKTRDGKIMQKVAGTAWVSEDDHELARIDVEVTDTISIGFGLLAKVHKGTRASGERRKINNEVWLPSRLEVLGDVRLLMLKGLNVREITEYSDYKKFNVETILSFPDLENPQP